MKGNISKKFIENEKIINIFQLKQDEKYNFLVHTESETEGKIYLYDIALDILTTIKTGLTVVGNSNGFDVVQGYSDLFFFTNGVEMFTIELYKLDTSGLTTTIEIKDFNITDREGKKVVGIGATVFDNRLWIFNNNRLWYSVQANIYDFKTADSQITTSAGYIDTMKNITAIHEFAGSLAIFYSDTSEMLSVNNGVFSRSEESTGGCASFNSLIAHDTNLYFYDDTKKSVFSFKEIINGQKTLGQNIAIEVQNILQEIDNTKLDKIKALSVFLEGRNEIWWLLPLNYDDGYSTILIFDYLKGEWVKRKSQKINNMAIVNNVLYSAGNDGNILEEYNSNTFNGEYIQHYYNCSPCNLGAMNTLKVLVFPPRVSLDSPYINNFFVKYIKNYDIFKKQKIKLVKCKLKNFLFWGQGFWNVNYWASKSTSNIGKFPITTFKVLQIHIYTTNDSQDFSIRNIEFSKIKVKQV